MNVAFPALLAFILVLPGIIFRYSYARGAWGWSSPTSLRSFSDDLAYGVAFALLLHLAWLALARAFHFPADVRCALALLAGHFGKNDEYLERSFAAVADHAAAVTTYFLSLYVAAAMLGYGAHRAVRSLALDHRFRPLRFDNYWYYMLTGEVLHFAENAEADRQVDGVYLSAVVDHSVGCFLYRGIVRDFTFDRNSVLDTIVLEGAHRRRLQDDRDASIQELPAAGDHRYYDIKGDFFVLRYSEMRTMNLDYFALLPDVYPSDRDGASVSPAAA